MFPRWSYEATVMRHRPIAFWPLGDTQTGKVRRLGGVQTTALTIPGTHIQVYPAAPGIVTKSQSLTGGAHVRGVDLENLSGSQVSFTAWVWTAALQQTHLFGAYQAGGAFDGWAVALGMATNNGGLSLWHGGGGWKQSAAALPADSRWHHVGYVITAAGNFVGYVDGVPAAGVAAGFPTSYTGTKAIAARADGDAPLSGGLSCPAVWNRALSAQEIAEQFRAGRSPSIPGRQRLLR